MPVGNAQTTDRFRLVVHLPGLGTETVPFTATGAVGMPPKGPEVVGIVDAGPAGQPAVFVLVDSGAATQFWTIFTPVGGRVSQATMSGQPLRLAVGGSALQNGGFSCDGPGAGLTAYGYAATSPAATSWTVSRRTYRWAGASLVLASREQATIRVPASSRRLAGYAGVRCGDLPPYAPR